MYNDRISLHPGFRESSKSIGAYFTLLHFKFNFRSLISKPICFNALVTSSASFIAFGKLLLLAYYVILTASATLRTEVLAQRNDLWKLPFRIIFI